MIKGIGLENFKAFKNNAYLDFKNINVFLGPNSSGKSSYLKGILTLKNTMESPSVDSAIQLTDRIGDFGSIVYARDLKEKVKYTVEFDVDRNCIEEFIENTQSSYAKLILLLIAKNKNIISEKKQDKKITIEVDLEINTNILRKVEFAIAEEAPKKPNRVIYFKMHFKNGDICIIEYKGDGYSIKYNEETVGDKDLIKPHKFFFRFNESRLINRSEGELDHINSIAIALLIFEQAMLQFTEDMLHIEPFRNEPRRSEMVANYKYGTVGSKGENMLTSLIGLQSNTDEQDDNKNKLRDEVNRWLDEFDLAEAVDIEDLRNNNYSLVIKNKRTSIPSNIVDVGVGTSQLLPIIIESVISPPNSTLLIEEPETHIHPNAQAKLAELFVACSQKYNKQFIIETHSMYLVRMLQILVAKKELKPEDIGVYYFEQDANGSHIVDLKLKENGQFEKAFPKGFFDVPLNLSSTLLEFM